MKKDKRASMISVRGGFSDVNGVSSSNTQMQVKEFDDKTRVLISNYLYDILQEVFDNSRNYIYLNIPRNGQLYSASSDFCKDILSNVFAQKTRLKEGRIFVWEDVYKFIDDTIEKAPYNEVLDIIWYICDWIKKNYRYHNNLHEENWVDFMSNHKVYGKEWKKLYAKQLEKEQGHKTTIQDNDNTLQ